eukprot:SAG22_NODE_1578_length_4071_cov_5.302870_2_plen_71_part_00
MGNIPDILEFTRFGRGKEMHQTSLLRDLIGPYKNSYVKYCLTPERSIATIPIHVAREFGKCQSKWKVSEY